GSGKRSRSLGRSRPVLGRGQSFDHAVLHEARKKGECLHFPEAKLLSDRGHVALPVHSEERAPALRREGDRALVGGLLRETEAHAVVGDRRADVRDAIARLGGALQQGDEVAALEICFGCGLPRRELEVGLRDREDRAERILAALAVHDRRDEASTREAERADFPVAAYLQLPRLRRARAAPYARLERKGATAHAQTPRR